MKTAFIFLFLSLAMAHADTPPPGTVKVKGGTDGTVIGNVGDAQKVTMSGAATAARQDTGNSSLSSIDTKLSNPLAVTQATVPSSLGRASIALSRNVYPTTNITTAAYVQLISSLPDSVNEVDVFDSSGQTLVLAVGALGLEVDKFYIIPGGNGPVHLAIPSGSRISVKAVSGTANTGELNLTFLK